MRLSAVTTQACTNQAAQQRLIPAHKGKRDCQSYIGANRYWCCRREARQYASTDWNRIRWIQPQRAFLFRVTRITMCGFAQPSVTDFESFRRVGRAGGGRIHSYRSKRTRKKKILYRVKGVGRYRRVERRSSSVQPSRPRLSRLRAGPHRPSGRAGAWSDRFRESQGLFEVCPYTEEPSHKRHE